MTKLNIINTRPKSSCKITTKIFEEHGFNVINFPCIEIAAPKHRQLAYKQLNNITANDVVLFTSQNAVNFAFKSNPILQLTKNNTIIAVGTQTAQLLEQQTNVDIWVPAKQNSIGVIELLQGLKHIRTIQLITAKNGREEIQNYATNHSINLQQINVYQRQLPKTNQQTIDKINQTNSLILLATSITTLINLQQLVPKTTWQHLLKNTIACASDRIALDAHKRGFSNIIDTQSANPKIIAQKINSAKFSN